MPHQESQAAETNASEQIELLREQVEFYRELVESLNLQLCDCEQEQQELEQELAHTNEDLCDALMSAQICLKEAKELAKTILKSKKSVSEFLADLLSAIYGSVVRPEELEIDQANITTPLSSTAPNPIILKSRELRENSKQNREYFNELGVRFVGSQANYMKFMEQFTELINKSTDENSLINDCESNEYNFTPPRK